MTEEHVHTDSPPATNPADPIASLDDRVTCLEIHVRQLTTCDREHHTTGRLLAASITCLGVVMLLEGLRR